MMPDGRQPGFGALTIQRLGSVRRRGSQIRGGIAWLSSLFT